MRKLLFIFIVFSLFITLSACKTHVFPNGDLEAALKEFKEAESYTLEVKLTVGNTTASKIEKVDGNKVYTNSPLNGKDFEMYYDIGKDKTMVYSKDAKGEWLKKENTEVKTISDVTFDFTLIEYEKFEKIGETWILKEGYFKDFVLMKDSPNRLITIKVNNDKIIIVMNGVKLNDEYVDYTFTISQFNKTVITLPKVN